MRIERTVFDGVRKHCEEEYPHEGCGVLGGEDDLVTRFVPVENAAKDQGFDVYYMDPVEQLAAFEELEEEGLKRMGFYHSHPDHGAYFSPRDRDNATMDGGPAYPGESYLVLSIGEGSFQEASVFTWEGAGFVEGDLDVV